MIAAQWSNTFGFGTALIGVVLAFISLGGFVWLVVRARGREKDLLNQIDSLRTRITNAEGNADSWHDERDAFASKADRLTQDLADERVKCAQTIAAINEEQTEIRHGLKNERDALALQLAAEKQKPDQTVVVEALRGMNDVNAANSQAMLATQERIAATQERTNELLERLADRVTASVAEKVGEVVKEKLEQNGHTTEGGKT